METTEENKQNTYMHPVVSVFAIVFFLWLGYGHGQYYLEGGHYRHLIFVIATLLVVLNRVLYLPKLVELIEAKSVLKKARSSLPFMALGLLGVYFVV